MKKAGIIGFASWFPETIKENDSWPSSFIDNFVSKNIVEEHKTLVDVHAKDTTNQMIMDYLNAEAHDPFLGSVQRRCANGTSSVDAETLAAKAVLDKTGIAGEELNYVISHSSMPDRVAPNSSSAVGYNVGATNALCLGMDTACSSSLTQMIVARSLVESGQAKYVLIVQSHIVLRAWPVMHPASPGVGDCATAMIIGLTDEHVIVGSHAVTLGEYYDSVTYTRGKQDDDTPWWMPSEKAFYLGSLNSPKAKELIMNTIPAGQETIQQAIKNANCDVQDIDCLISVQPRKWIPEGIARSLGLSPEVAIQTYEKYAHLGPCGIVANLEEAEKMSLLKPGSLVALYAQGAGFSKTSVIVKW